MKRLIDLLLSIICFFLFLIPAILIGLGILLTSKGNIIFWSKRVGKRNRFFYMPKFRTMRQDTPVIATHLLVNPEFYLTPIGSFLRKSSLDELPQIWSIFVGDMSFVGPRPALHNQDDLVRLRTRYGLQEFVPGLTGWAQINGRDELSISEKVMLDKYYLDNQSLMLDLKIILTTIFKVVHRVGIKH